jgi:hypothetical protein
VGVGVDVGVGVIVGEWVELMVVFTECVQVVKSNKKKRNGGLI